MRKLQRGYSLEESLVASGLFSLVTLLAIQLLTPCLRIFTQDQSQARLDETALVASRSVERDVLPSSLKSITTSAQGFSLLAGDSFDAYSGNPIWSKYVVYYYQDNAMWRKEVVLSPFTMQTARMSPGELSQAINTSNGSEHVVMQNVQNVTINLGTTLQVAATLQVPGLTGGMNLQVRPRR